MTMRVRAVLMLTVALAMMGLVSCDHYVCTSGAQFGSSSCTATGSGLGSGGSSGSATAAFAFDIDTAGTIDGYTLNTTAGTFAPTTSYTAPTVPTSNGGVGMVVAQAQYLYAGFGNIGELYGWTIDSSGDLTAISGSPYSAPFLADYVTGVGETNMIVNPAGTLLFFAATGVDQIYAFQIGTGGALTAVAGSPFSATFPFGGGPMNLAIDGLGKYLYASNGNYLSHTATQILTYSIGSTGALTPVGTALNSPMWLLKGEPTGKFMIGTSGNAVVDSGFDDTHLYVFSIGSTGALTEVTGSPFTTQFSPFSIAVQSNSAGNLVYSFSFNDTATAFNGVEGYEISSTGTLTAVSGSPFTGVAEGSWGQFDQSGAFLMVYASYVPVGTDTVITQLGPDEIGSAGLLTQPISTLTLATPGFWVVTDPQ
jgi:6-phosphogluconolactonase